MGQQIVIPRGETAYVYVFTPQPPMEGSSNKEPQFSSTFLWDEDNPKLEKLRKAILEVAEEKWGKKAGDMLKKGQLKSPLRDGSEKEDAKDADLYEGKVFLKASSTDRPQVVDRNLEDIIDKFDVYSGCIARGDIWLFPYDKAGNKGVGAILNSFQKLDDGERRSGRRSAEDAFAGEDDEDEDELV
jgi:Protein of unknown function (DUF2815)